MERIALADAAHGEGIRLGIIEEHFEGLRRIVRPGETLCLVAAPCRLQKVEAVFVAVPDERAPDLRFQIAVADILFLPVPRGGRSGGRRLAEQRGVAELLPHLRKGDADGRFRPHIRVGGGRNRGCKERSEHNQNGDFLFHFSLPIVTAQIGRRTPPGRTVTAGKAIRKSASFAMFHYNRDPFRCQGGFSIYETTKRAVLSRRTAK